MTPSNYNSVARNYRIFTGKSVLDFNVDLRLAAQNGTVHKLKFGHRGQSHVDADFILKDADHIFSDFGTAFMVLKSSRLMLGVALLCAALGGITFVLLLINLFYGGSVSPYHHFLFFFLLATLVLGVVGFILARKRIYFFEYGLEQRIYSVTGRLKKVVPYAYKDLYAVDVSQYEIGVTDWSLIFKAANGTTNLNLGVIYGVSGEIDALMEYWLANLAWQD